MGNKGASLKFFVRLYKIYRESNLWGVGGSGSRNDALISKETEGRIRILFMKRRSSSGIVPQSGEQLKKHMATKKGEKGGEGCKV